MYFVKKSCYQKQLSYVLYYSGSFDMLREAAKKYIFLVQDSPYRLRTLNHSRTKDAEMFPELI